MGDRDDVTLPDTPGASALPADLREQFVRLEDMRPQSEANLAGRLTP